MTRIGRIDADRYPESSDRYPEPPKRAKKNTCRISFKDKTGIVFF
jgi:hypothetical protein